jgi:hypothetical protein
MASVGYVIDLLHVMVLEDLENLVTPVRLRRGGGHVSPIRLKSAAH